MSDRGNLKMKVQGNLYPVLHHYTMLGSAVRSQVCMTPSLSTGSSYHIFPVVSSKNSMLVYRVKEVAWNHGTEAGGYFNWFSLLLLMLSLAS